MLRNWVLGFLAMAIWTANYLAYFAPDIRAWYRRRGREAVPVAGRFDVAPPPGFMGPLPPHQRVRFPSAPPTPSAAEAAPEGAEVIAFPRRRRPRPGS